MRVGELLWLPEIVEQLSTRHCVESDEVAEVFANAPHVRFGERGNSAGENLYRAYGRMHAGRYLAVFFIYKQGCRALLVTARETDRRERRLYRRSQSTG